MLILVFRGIFLVGILSWYSTNVWKMIDGYFKDSFERYLQREYQKNPKMRDDVSAYGASGENVRRPGETSARDGPPKGESEMGGCERLSALGEETCPMDLASVVASTGGEAGSGSSSSSSSGSLSAGEMTDGGHVKGKSGVSGSGDLHKNAYPEISSISKAARTTDDELSASGKNKNVVDDVENSTSVSNEDSIDVIRDKMVPKKNAASKVSKSHVEHPDAGKTDAKRSSGKVSQRRSSRDQRKGDTAEGRTKRTKKQKVQTIVLTDEDFEQAKTRAGPRDYDFSEFDDDEDGDEHVEGPPEGVLVSELPFKPRADIGKLERVTDEEFCPLTLDDGVNCGETRSWP